MRTVANILIIEDDLQTAEEIAGHLDRAGHACTVRNEGNGVMEALRTSTPDLLVLDIMLPDASGFEICRSIRRDEELYSLPILVISAMSDEEEVQHGLAQGADIYLTKPYDANQLVQRVNALLHERGSGDLVDPVTGLPNHDGVRRELQKHIGREESFALVYAETLCLREFSKVAGAEGREKAVRHVARALQVVARKLCEEDLFFIGHMGSGHFMCLLPIDQSENFCQMAKRIWSQHVETLYESLGQTQALEKGISILDLQFYVTYRKDSDTNSAQDLLDVVSRIRSTAAGAIKGGIHVDRRA